MESRNTGTKPRNIRPLTDGDLQSYVGEFISRGQSPALSIAVYRGENLHAAAGGIANEVTPTLVSTDTLFQIGSISKTFTASLIMMLVDAGELELDAPLRRYLPEFHVSDRDAVAQITTAQLLSHTGGLESDIYVDDCWEQGNAIARYVDRCFLLPQVHKDFGKRFSYSNAGYVIAGRLLEVMLGMPWCRAIEEQIYKPLGMKLAISSPLQTLRYQVATGHMGSTDAEKVGWRVAPHAFVPQGLAPAGSALAMSAAELVRFGRAHLEAGRSEIGRQWLSKESTASMQDVRVRLPACPSVFATGYGLGWELCEFDGVRCFGHTGGRIGYQALLTVIPDFSAVIAIESNGMSLGGSTLLRRVFADLMNWVTGISVLRDPPREENRELHGYVGQYGGAGFTFTVKQKGAQLEVDFVIEGLSTEAAQIVLKPTIDGNFAVYSLAGEYMGEAAFLERNLQGQARYFFFAGRLNARTSAE